MRDLFNSVHPVRGISPQVAVTNNTAFVSQIIDRKGYMGLLFLLALGSLADADATFVVLMEHGDAANLSDAVAVPDEELQGTELLAAFNFGDDNETRKIGYAGSKQYVRLTVTPANNTGDVYLSAIALLHNPQIGPTPNPPV